MTTFPFPHKKSSNAFARKRDAGILWLLERHPVTAGMLAGLGWFPSRKKASQRLQRLVQRQRIRFLGTVLLKDGRPEHVYGRARWMTKGDTLRHEVLLTQVCLKVDAEKVRRGPPEVDRHLLPDAELFIRGVRYFLELDCGTMTVPTVVHKRFAKYRAVPDFVLWVCPTERRREALRRQAHLLRATALFATLEQVLRNPHAPVWMDADGQRAALPRARDLGKSPEDSGGDRPWPLAPPASGVPTTTVPSASLLPGTEASDVRRSERRQ